jgi:hypothetical protein
MRRAGIHEDYTRSHLHRQSSNRSFGSVFSAFFLIMAAWPMLHGRPVRLWALVLSGVFLLVTAFRPSLLGPLNRLWTAFGLLLGRIVNPLVTSFIFFLVFTPAGYISRLLRRDPLRLRREPDADSYWIPKDRENALPDGMRHQF